MHMGEIGNGTGKSPHRPKPHQLAWEDGGEGWRALYKRNAGIAERFSKFQPSDDASCPLHQLTS